MTLFKNISCKSVGVGGEVNIIPAFGAVMASTGIILTNDSGISLIQQYKG